MAKKILVIDDDSDFIEAMTSLLEAKDFTVCSAVNSDEGFELAKKETPDLILLDVMMTRKTEGFDASKKFQQDALTRNIPIILITGIRKDMSLPFGFEPDQEWLPVKTVLEKPVKPDTLFKAIDEYITK